MQIKSGLLALSAVATLMCIGGNTAEAKSGKTHKKTEVETVKVKAGDSLSSIAKKHHITYIRLFNANKSIKNPNQIDVGDKVIIPAKHDKLKNRWEKLFASVRAEAEAAAAQPVATSSMYAQESYAPQPQTTSVSFSGSSAGNTYASGYCTWYVKNRRSDIPNNLGNGGSWTANAAAQGFKTGSKPKAGAVAEEAGHVAYVESVNKNGTVNISEMNYGGGVGQKHTRTVSASTFHYIY